MIKNQRIAGPVEVDCIESVYADGRAEFESTVADGGAAGVFADVERRSGRNTRESGHDFVCI
jgi:hypothetical protein